MTFSHDSLLESKDVRMLALKGATDEYALIVLNKAKSVLMAAWNGVNYATTEQVAEYYEVKTTTIIESLRASRDEFGDEVETIKGKRLKDVKQIICLSQKAPQALLWTSRAFLRIGLILRDSSVAKVLRDIVVNSASNQAMVVPQVQLTFMSALTVLGKGIEESTNLLAQRINDAQQHLSVQMAGNNYEINQRLSNELHNITEEIKDLKTSIVIQPQTNSNVTAEDKAVSASKKRNPGQDRNINVHVPTDEIYERWLDLADKSGMSRSRFFFEILYTALEGNNND